METKQKTFSALSVLKATQENVKAKLGDKYPELVAPYVQIIEMVMKANAINEFEAMKKIKDNTEIYKKVDAPLFFSAALSEITLGKHFVGFKEKINL